MKKAFLLTIALVLSLSCSAQLLGKVKTINVVPDKAKIIMGGAEVGQGSYSLNMGRQDYVMLRLTCPGYVDRVVRVYRNDKRNAISFTLEEDESFSASEANSDLANKYMTVTVREGLTSDVVWKRLILTISDLFPNLEVNDKEAGWIRSAWEVERFAYVTVRTRIEIKEVMGFDTPRYRVRLQSEIASNECGTHDECYKAWDRVLKTYIESITDLISSIQ
ncbi:MAG: hypothetical protein IKJ18_03255 [Bacteroidaceae bacterium]|nr:hypothetical protein [Bacteroidaceae bacterium]